MEHCWFIDAVPIKKWGFSRFWNMYIYKYQHIYIHICIYLWYIYIYLFIYYYILIYIYRVYKHYWWFICCTFLQHHSSTLPMRSCSPSLTSGLWPCSSPLSIKDSRLKPQTLRCCSMNWYVFQYHIDHVQWLPSQVNWNMWI